MWFVAREEQCWPLRSGRWKEHKLHLLPTGILHPHIQCYIGAGTVIDPAALLQEMKGLNSEGRLWISPKSHLIMPYHKVLDGLQEADKGALSIGTTGKGIGPAIPTARLA